MDDSPYWTPLRKELVNWLSDNAPSFVDGYTGAVRLLHMPFPGRVHFICHAVRDIYRHLPTTLGVRSLARPAEVFPNMAKELAIAWNSDNSVRAPSRIDGITSGVVVSRRVFKCAERIVIKSNELNEQNKVGKNLAIALFRSLDLREGHHIAPWIFEAFNAEYGFFVQRAHLAVSIDKVLTDEGLLEHFESFERAFHSLVGPYFSGKEELDAILKSTNPAGD